MDLVLFGIQGSGKGTQARLLAAESGYRIFEAGGALRAIAAIDTDLGRTVKGYVDAGHLVPHAIIMQVLREAILATPREQEILFDGIPRDLDQMRDFDAVMLETGRDFRCIVLTVDEEAAIKRILKRAAVEKRADDASQERIRRRMALFHEKTEPVIALYRARGIVEDIDGEGAVKEVHERLAKVVGVMS